MAKNLTAESLNLLLAKFSEDERQAAADYANLCDSLVRFFALKGDSDPAAAADETLDRTAAKVAANTPIDDVKKYSFGVARLIYFERLRFSQKETNAAKDFYSGKTASPIDDETNDFELLRECFKSLPAAERNFLQRYFTDAPHRKLAELRRRLNDETGFSAGQTQVKVFRLRKRLERCVHEKNQKK